MQLLVDLWDELRARPGPYSFTLLGASMWPAAPPGSVLSVGPCESRALLPGELVVFRHRGSIVTHRVVRVLEDGRVLSWGDSLLAPDGFIAPMDVLGKARIVTRASVFVGWRSGWLLVRRTAAELIRLTRGLGGREA